jgi:hypothetical protein
MVLWELNCKTAGWISFHQISAKMWHRKKLLINDHHEKNELLGAIKGSDFSEFLSMEVCPIVLNRFLFFLVIILFPLLHSNLRPLTVY